MKKSKQAGVPKRQSEPKYLTVLVIGPTGKKRFVKEANPRYAGNR